MNTEACIKQNENFNSDTMKVVERPKRIEKDNKIKSDGILCLFDGV